MGSFNGPGRNRRRIETGRRRKAGKVRPALGLRGSGPESLEERVLLATAPQIVEVGLYQAALDTANPRVTGTLYERGAVEVLFSKPMNSATINKDTVNLFREAPDGVLHLVSADSRVTVTYNGVTNRAVINLSALPDSELPRDQRYVLRVSDAVADSAGLRLDGEFATNEDPLTRRTVFPSGDLKPLPLEQTDNDPFLQILPPLFGTSGPDVFTTFDSGIPGDQNTNVTQPWFRGQVTTTSGSRAGLLVVAQFNALGSREGTPAELRVGAGGLGFEGQPDWGARTDASGFFSFPAPVDLPDGFHTVRIVVVGEADPGSVLPGPATQLDQSFRIDTTNPQIQAGDVTSGSTLSGLRTLSIDVVDPILPNSLFDRLVVPTQLSLPALDPTRASNLSNYSLYRLDATGAMDFSSFIVGANFVSTTNRASPVDPYTGRIDLSFAQGLPAGNYALVARRPQPGFEGLTDAAGNPIDGNPHAPGAQDLVIQVNIEPTPAFITQVKALSPIPNGPDFDPFNPATFTLSDPRSYYEQPVPGVTPRADAPPQQFIIDFSNPLPDRGPGGYNGFVRLIRSADSSGAPSDGNFGVDSTFTTGVGYSEIPGLSVTLTNSNPLATNPNSPGFRNRLVIDLPAGFTLPADTYRLYVPNRDLRSIGGRDLRLIDIYENQLDGEFLGNPTAAGGWETLLPTGVNRAGLSGDGVQGGAFETGYIVVPNGNIIYARPDYVDDPFLTDDDPDGSLLKPYSALAAEAIATPANGGDLNSALNFGTGFDPRFDRNQNGRFDRSALFAAQVASARGPVVVVALPGVARTDPNTGQLLQETFVLAAPSGNDPITGLPRNASASVPFNTTLAFAPGSALKMFNASLYVQNQGSALQARGIDNPNDPNDDSLRVTFTSVADDSVGGDTNRDGAPGSGGDIPGGGDWGGLVFRNYDQGAPDPSFSGLPRQNRVPFPVDGRLKGPGGSDARSGADEALSMINFARLRYGGGPVPQTQGTSQDGPITLFNSRPALTNSVISDSRMVIDPNDPNPVPGAVTGTVGAITADFNSFREDDLARGPLIRKVDVINNSINGIFIRAELSGEARQTNAINYSNVLNIGGTRNFAVDDPLPHVLTTRLAIGLQETELTGGRTTSVTNRLYVQPGMMFKMPQGAAIDVLTPGAGINIGDRAYMDMHDIYASMVNSGAANLSQIGPGFPNGPDGLSNTFDQRRDDFRTNTAGDAQVVFTSFYDDLATTFYRDPNTGVTRTIVPAIDTDGQPGFLQPTTGNVPQGARWGGVKVFSGGLAVIDEAQFRFGGGSVNIPGGTIPQRAVLAFENAGGSVIGYNGLTKTLVGANGTTAKVTNNDFFDNLQAAATITPNGLLAGNPQLPLFSGNPFFRGNIFENNTLNGLEVLAFQGSGSFSPNLTVDSVWDDWDVPYILRGSVRLDGATFDIPAPDTDQFQPQLRPYVSLTLQSGLPDTLLADGTQIARPGETLLVKMLGGGPGNGESGSSSDNNGGAGFMVGVDDGIDPTNPDPYVDPGAFSQIRIIGIGENESTGQQRVPVVLTSIFDDSAVATKTVRGRTMGDATRPTNTVGTRAPAPGDGGLIYFGGNSLSDYNLYDPRDGNLIENAVIRYITRIEQQGGGIVYSSPTVGDARALTLGVDEASQFNTARALTISNSTLDNFRDVGLLAHPNPTGRLEASPLGGGATRNTALRGMPTLTFMYNNTISNMPVGVRVNSEITENATAQRPAELMLLHNTFFNTDVAVRTVAPAPTNTNQYSHVHTLAMNNIFDTFTTAIDVQGRATGFSGQVSQGQFNLFGSTPVIQGGFDNFNAVVGNPLFRNPAILDFTPQAGSAAIDAGLSELGANEMGNSLLPIAIGPSGLRIPSIPGSPTSPRSNAVGIDGSGRPGDIVTLPGLPTRPFDDQWLPALPGTFGAQPGAASNPATFHFRVDPGERRDQRGYLRVDDPETPRVGAGTNPFFDIGALERRIITAPRIVSVTATLRTATGVETVNFYEPGEGVGANRSPLELTITFDQRVNPATISSSTVTLEASGGDGVFRNQNNAQDRFINLAGKVRPGANGQSIIIDLTGITPSLTNDRFRVTVLGSGANVVRNTRGDALDGENTVGGSPDGLQLPLDMGSGNGVPGGNFYVSFTIDTTPPAVFPGSLVLAATSDTGARDGITSNNTPTFTGNVFDQFPLNNPGSGHTVFLLTPGPDHVIGTGDDLVAGSAISGPAGFFSVTYGGDAANTGLLSVDRPAVMPDTPVDVGPDGLLGTGDDRRPPDVVRIFIVDASGNTSSLLTPNAYTTVIIDSVGPQVVSTSPAPGGLANVSTDQSGQARVSVILNENIDPASLTSASFSAVRAGGDNSFNEGNEERLFIGLHSLTVVPGTTQGSMWAEFLVTPVLANDLYRITLSGTEPNGVRDIAGNLLDGDRNGTPGGDFHLEFVVFNPGVSRIIYVNGSAQPNPNATGSFSDPASSIDGVIVSGPDGDVLVPGGLDLARPGDIVAVLPGTYRESINLKSLVSLVSASPASNDTTIVPGDPLQTLIWPLAGSSVAVAGSGVLSVPNFTTEFSGFTVVAPQQGTGGAVDPNTSGVFLVNSDVLVRRNYILNSGRGIGVSTSGPDARTPRIENNVILGNDVGIFLVDEGAPAFQNGQPVRIYNNTIAFNTIGLGAASPVGGPLVAEVANNIFAQNYSSRPGAPRSGWAITSSAIDEVQLSANLFSNNGATDASALDDVNGSFIGLLPNMLTTNPATNPGGNFLGDPAFNRPRDPRPSPQGGGLNAFFLNNDGLLFEPTRVSAAIDNGLPLLSNGVAPALDFLNRTRVNIANMGLPGRGPTDLGAFEFLGGTAATATVRLASTESAPATGAPMTAAAAPTPTNGAPAQGGTSGTVSLASDLPAPVVVGAPATPIVTPTGPARNSLKSLKPTPAPINVAAQDRVSRLAAWKNLLLARRKAR